MLVCPFELGVDARFQVYSFTMHYGIPIYRLHCRHIHSKPIIIIIIVIIV